MMQLERYNSASSTATPGDEGGPPTHLDGLPQQVPQHLGADQLQLHRGLRGENGGGGGGVSTEQGDGGLGGGDTGHTGT